MGYTERKQGAQRSEDAPFFIVSHLIFGAKKKNNVSKTWIWINSFHELFIWTDCHLKLGHNNEMWAKGEPKKKKGYGSDVIFFKLKNEMEAHMHISSFSLISSL